MNETRTTETRTTGAERRACPGCGSYVATPGQDLCALCRHRCEVHGQTIATAAAFRHCFCDLPPIYAADAPDESAHPDVRAARVAGRAWAGREYELARDQKRAAGEWHSKGNGEAIALLDVPEGIEERDQRLRELAEIAIAAASAEWDRLLEDGEERARSVALVTAAIDELPDATDEEKDALDEILDGEGFVEREYECRDRDAARALAVDRLEWYRSCRAPGAIDARG